MIPSFIAWAFALTLLAQPIGDPPGFNHPEFLCYTEGSGRFLALLRRGNGPDLTGNITGPERNGHLIVFEYLGKDKPLRKLYEATLITNDWVIAKLSRDGRFFVTLDDMQSSGIRPHTVVIYDLARKERTAYAGKDFMNEELIKSLPIPGWPPYGFKWRGLDYVFNSTNTKFYPTLPSNCKRERVPFVVIDLPTRTVRVKPVPSEDPKDIVPARDRSWRWLESGDTVSAEKTIIPRRLMRIGKGDLFQVFELAPNEVEYIPIKSNTPEREK